MAVPCDIRDPEVVAAAFDAVEKRLGPANQLGNNAVGHLLCLRSTVQSAA